MMLSPYYHNSIFPPKTLVNPSSPSFFPTHKTLSLQNLDKPSKSLFKCSTTQNRPQTRPGNGAEKVPKSAIQRIAEKLRSLGIVEQTNREQNKNREDKSAGEIFIPLPDKIPKYRVGHTIDSSWSTPENPVPMPGSGSAIVRYNELNRELGRQKRLAAKTHEKEKVAPSLAELKLSQREVRRLQTIGIGLRKKLKIGKAGITEGIVNGIHERWRNAEVVKIVCDDLCRLNMKRTHDLLERKTGGLVVWRSGSKIILYRGADYKYPYFFSDRTLTNEASPEALPDPTVENEGLDKIDAYSSPTDNKKPPQPSLSDKRAQSALIHGVGSTDKLRFQLPGEAELVEEADRLLEGLGPRFTDWWGYDPQPIDADLLPAMVPGYRRPFRLLPFGVQPKLTNDEMTTLRRLGRPLPCHFVLGRNRKLQGLAAAIVKLWEKCEIAKIAVKRGVQNTNSELMAEELKWLTGGTLLARDREFIVLYRGKDFLPHAVSSAIEERRKHVVFSESPQQEELSTSNNDAEELKLPNVQDDVGNNVEDDSEDELGNSNGEKVIVNPEHENLRSTEAAVRRTSIKLSMALEKKAKAEKLLAELEKREIHQELELDKEGITEEERYMLRKVGLRMKAFLLLGRRGVFDGTVENMHLHWKYRELVKIISKERNIEAVHREARILERESGGILVAVERVIKGYAIIMYRGKNYERPETLRPKTLLTKREAMKRSLEAQRRQSLKLHVLELAKKIDNLKLQLDKDEEANTRQSVDISRTPQVKEEIDDQQPAKEVRSENELNLGNSVTVTSNEGTVEVRDAQEADSSSVNSNGPVDATADIQPLTELDRLINFPSCNMNDIQRIDFESTSNCENKETQQEGMSKSAAFGNEHYVTDNEATDSSLIPAEEKSDPSIPKATENGSNEMVSRAVHLSNRDRLLLRKQALRMKKRPVLAVGRSNIVTGVAKTINAHFEKHPLAIVNVKGRAKGTSVQEVILKLQEATGAVLVSQEPSKVILYRGWGAEEDECSRRKKANRRDDNKATFGKKVERQPAVSPELLAAIRLECGLQNHLQEESLSKDNLLRMDRF